MDIEILPIITSWPVWEERTWRALQAKKFDDFRKYLQEFLLTFSPEEWDGILWDSMIAGIPAIRGGLDEVTWDKNAVPVIAKVIFTITPPSELELVYKDSGLNIVREIHNAFINSFQGGVEEKLAGIKKIYPNFYSLFVAMPGQVLGMEVVPAHSVHGVPSAAELQDRYLALTDRVREKMVSVELADMIYRTGQNFRLTDEKISDLAKVIGLVMLGVVRLDEIDREIARVLAIDSRLSQEIADEINRKMVAELSGEIETGRMTYAPPNVDTEIFMPIEELISGKADEEVTLPTTKTPPPRAGGIASLRIFPDEFKRSADEIRVRTNVPSSAQAPVSKSAEEFFKTEPVATPVSNQKEAKPFVLYEDKNTQSTTAPIRKTSVSFSMPFGFFSKDGSGATKPASASQPVRASIDMGTAKPEVVKTSAPGILGKIMRKEQARTVHYAGPGTPVTPFRKEGGGIFNVDADSKTDRPASSELAQEVKQEVVVKPVLEKIPDKEISVKPVWPAQTADVPRENPFGFPNTKASNGPRVEGNTVRLD